MSRRTEFFNSSALATATYDDETEELEIVFANGALGYTFHGVPPEIFEGLVSAPSAGRYYHTVIKGNYV